MLNSMYETLANKKTSIRSEIERLLDIRDVEKYRSLWREKEFAEKKTKIGGEDGSFNFKKYKNFVLYAVDAIAVIYDSRIEEVEGSDIGILYPYKSIEERLKLYQSIFELKISLQVIDDVDIFLLDGSLLSKLSTPEHLVLSTDERKEVLGLLPELEASDDLGITSIRYAKELGKFEKIAYLEYLELLTTAGKLLEKGMDKIVGVSKTSTWSDFNQGISDMAVFEELTTSMGFSKPTYRPLMVGRAGFPTYNELFESIVFTTFYARLGEKNNVFMFETPREIGEAEIVDILNRVKSICVEGYPYLLRKAHRKVVIKDKDIERIFTSLGIPAKTGREML